MSPYLAVIKDSFREALASRVLWVLLVVITLLLFVLAPFGFTEKATTYLGDGDVQNPMDFVQRIQAAGETEDKNPSRRIWDKLSEKQRTSLSRFQPGRNPNGIEMARVMSRFIERLNELIDDKSFYVAEYWKDARFISQEGRNLIKRRDDGETLTKVEIGRMNRLALEAAFPDIIKTGFPTSMQFKYGSMNFGPTLPVSRADFDQTAKTGAGEVMKWFVGIIGVIVAILITSSIIPQMFDPGSLHLLLSFPVSRSMLFLAKYLGGCAFTFLSAAYLIGGLWLLLGIRFGVWEASLLYCIPLYVFFFAIYYSVSALAGIVWRNSLVSIACAVLFWLACFSIGMLKSGYESFFLESTKFSKLVETENSVIGVNETGVAREWDEGAQEWREVFQTDAQKAMQIMFAFMPEVPPELRSMGPVYDPSEKRLVNVYRDMTGGSGGMVLSVGNQDQGWEPKVGAAPPSGMVDLVVTPDGDLLAISSYGLYQATGDIAKKPEKGERLFNVIPLPNMTKGPFQKVGPDPAVVLTRPLATTIDQVNSDIVLYSRSQATILTKTENGFEKKLEAELDVESNKQVVIAASGGNVLVGRPDGVLLLYDDQLQLKKELEPEKGSAPNAISASPDGATFAVTFNNGKLWLVDAEKMDATYASVTGQGTITATLFRDKSRLLVTHQSVRVIEYNLDDGSRGKRYAPAMDMLETAYRFVIYPIYIICPKPSELNRTIDFTLADEEGAKKIENPLQPVWSSGAFILGVLLICCFMIERQEF